MLRFASGNDGRVDSIADFYFIILSVIN